MIGELEALVLAEDPESAIGAAYAERIAGLRARHHAARPRRPGAPLRVLLAGYSGAHNTGADVRTGEIVRHLDAAFGGRLELGAVVVGRGGLPGWERVRPEVIEGYPPDAVVEMCARYDAVVVCEGSLFTSTFSNSLAMLLTAFLGTARAMGKPAIAWGAEADGMTPELADFVQRCADDALLIARNPASAARLAALGLDAELGTDTAWTYAAEPREQTDAALRTLGWDGQAELLVLCPTNPFRWPLIADPARAMLARLNGEADADHCQGMLFFQPSQSADARCAAFLEAVARAVEAHAAKRPHGVFPVIIGMEANDAAACVQLARRLGAPPPLVAGAVPPARLVGVLRAAARIVSARYHAVLLAMGAGVPAVGLAYDQRLRALLGDAGHRELALAVDAPDLARVLAARLDVLARNDLAIGHDFAAFAAEQRAMQAAMASRAADYLAGALA